MPNKDLKYLVALHSFQKFGSVKIRKILKHFPSAEVAFASTGTEFVRAGIDEKTVQLFTAARAKINPDAIWEKYQKEKIEILTEDAPNYPALLAEIHNPPAILYYRGEIKKEELALAIVGTRKFTDYGRIVTEKLTSALVEHNFTIVSGLAQGVDTLAHKTTLNKNGRTIAVLGTSLSANEIYPASNRLLVERIIANRGAIISEFPIGTEPHKFNFPQRNRIIAGLSHGTVVIEAGEKSGALITADFALEQGREIFAVPGNVFSAASAGPNNLIKAGAKPVTKTEDILEAFQMEKRTEKATEYEPQTPEEGIILKNLSYKPIHINELIRKTDISPSTIGSTLIILEMNGIIKNIGGMQYVLL